MVVGEEMPTMWGLRKRKVPISFMMRLNLSSRDWTETPPSEDP
jgi:hypothetical protein